MPQINTVGDHVVKVVALRLGETANQNEYIEFDMVRDDGSDIQSRLYLSEKALQTIKEGRAYGTIPTMAAVFSFDLKTWNGDEAILAANCVGKYCSVATVFEADQNGKEWLRVKYINPLRRSEPIKDQGSFQKRIKMRLAKMPALPPVPGVAPSRQAPTKSAPTATPVTEEPDPFA